MNQTLSLSHYVFRPRLFNFTVCISDAVFFFDGLNLLYITRFRKRKDSMFKLDVSDRSVVMCCVMWTRLCVSVCVR